MTLGCGDSEPKATSDASEAVDAESSQAACTLASEALASALDEVSTDTDFVLRLRTLAGREFAHSVGTASATASVESASTSKWVTAAIILSLVERGELALDAPPQEYIEFWTSDPVDPLSRVTLAQLLSFTSGLEEAAFCSNLGAADFETCIESNYEANLVEPVEPGTAFYYGSTHMQVAGLMAMRAVGASTWGEVFTEFQSRTGLFGASRYDLPSESNPRLAGGMHWTANDYLDFLDDFAHGRLLSAALQSSMIADNTRDVAIRYSPALEGVEEDWHYGLGLWLECPSATFDCASITRVSSPGAYGAYPFLDFEEEYYGILARQGDLGTFAEGKAVLDAVAQETQAWARCDN